MNIPQIPLLKKIKILFRNTIKYSNLIFFISSSILLIYFGAKNFNMIEPYIAQVRIKFLLLSFTIIIIGEIGAGLIWHRIVKKVCNNSDLIFDIKTYLYSLLGTILPGSIWNIVNKLSNYKKRGVPESEILVCSLTEAIFISLGSFIAFVIFFSIINTNLLNIPKIIFIVILLIAIILVQPKYLERFFKKFSRKEPDYILKFVHIWDYKTIIFLSITEGIITILGATGIFLLITSFFKISISYYSVFVAVYALTNVFGNILFFLPGTLILRDGLFFSILTFFLSNQEGLVFTILQRIWLIFIIIITSIFTWLIFDILCRKKDIRENILSG